MALIITDECINCDVCEPECPNEAVDPDRTETPAQLRAKYEGLMAAKGVAGTR